MHTWKIISSICTLIRVVCNFEVVLFTCDVINFDADVTELLHGDVTRIVAQPWSHDLHDALAAVTSLTQLARVRLALGAPAAEQLSRIGTRARKRRVTVLTLHVSHLEVPHRHCACLASVTQCNHLFQLVPKPLHRFARVRVRVGRVARHFVVLKMFFRFRIVLFRVVCVAVVYRCMPLIYM